MERNEKIIVAISAVVAIVCTAGLAFSIISVAKSVDQSGASSVSVTGAAGETFSTGRVAQIGVDYSTTTLASLYNDSGRDRVIKRVYAYTNKWLINNSASTNASTTLLVATSSVASSLGSNTNYVFNGTMFSAPATSTSFTVVTSTVSVSADGYRLWPAGTYLNFVTATTMTSTLAGIAGVEFYNY